MLLIAPTTASQKAIWTSAQMSEEANCAYNLSYALELKGDLELELWQKAMEIILERHDSFRSSVNQDGSNLVIAPNLTVEIPLMDLSDCDEGEQQEQLTTLIKQITQTPFDLEEAPLWRIQAIKLHEQQYQIIITIHQIICDDWSWWLWLTELGKIYCALKQGQPPELEVAETFREYAIAEDESSRQPQRQKTEAFWLKQFEKEIPSLDLPTDRPRPAVRTFNSARVDRELDANVVAKVKDLGIKQGSSLMATMLAAFEVFLYRLSGQAELTVGVPTSGQAFAGKYNLTGH
jgi:NRPS condensation-like uncharacterized protein